MVDIVINEDLINHVNEYDAILISTNCYQSMRNGFQYEVIKQYPHVLEWNYTTKYGDSNKLGTILECKEEDKPLFILMFNTFLYNYRRNDDDFFDYDSLVNCIKLLNILYNGKHLASTMIGCSEYDGNADKNEVLKIINEHVTDFDLTIYDYKQESYTRIRQRDYMINLKKRYARNKQNNRNRRKNKKKKGIQQGNSKNP